MKHLKLLSVIFVLSFFITSSLHSDTEVFNSAYFGLATGYNFEEKHTDFSLMIGYDRHFEGTPEFTLGIVTELIFGKHSELMVGIPIGFYPVEEVKLWVAPCYAFVINSEEKEELTYDPHSDEVLHIVPEDRFMLKFGAGYNYHFHNTNIAVLPFIDGTLVGKDFILGIGVKFNLYF